eukprot:610099-Hanusia_phi.AAC.3
MMTPFVLTRKETGSGECSIGSSSANIKLFRRMHSKTNLGHHLHSITAIRKSLTGCLRSRKYITVAGYFDGSGHGTSLRARSAFRSSSSFLEI